MDEKQRRISENRIKSLFQQLHLTSVYDLEMTKDVGLREVLFLRDKILDEIILHQRKLGLRI